jgi:[ribosomal protein S18]-alanine N-acetyltransferase
MLRKLTPQDAPSMYAMEVSANHFPWSLHQFTDSFAIGDFGWGIERANLLVAFALFSHVIDEATLLNIVVHPHWQRRGMARELLVCGLQQLSERGAARCLLEVRVGNLGAIALYSSLGFDVDGRRRDYYPAAHGREDALLMSRHLPFKELENV